MKRLIAAFVVALALTVGVGKALSWTDSPTLDETASWLAGHPVKVHCKTRSETYEDFVLFNAYGYVVFTGGKPDNFMTLGSDVCAPLLRWLKDRVHNTDEDTLAIAVMVLTHESSHLRGETNEARAQCWATRHIRYVALHLGFSPTEARTIRDLAIKWDAKHNEQFPQYDLPGCQRPVVGSP